MIIDFVHFSNHTNAISFKKKKKRCFLKKKVSHHLVSPEIYLLSIFSEASSHTVDVTLAPSPQAYTQMVTVSPFSGCTRLLLISSC